MKSIISYSSVVVLLLSPAYGQDIGHDMQYVSSQRGDTLVVKDDIEYGGSNVLYLIMQSDSLAPATRVYELKNNGIYSLVNNPQSSKIFRTIIRGQTETSLKKSTGAAPPIITGGFGTGITVTGGMNVNKDLLIKNVDLEIGNSSGGGGGWAWFYFTGPNMRLQVDNCIMEHTWWTWVGGPPADTRIFFNNCYFVNLDGHSCRRNGGVVDFNATGVTHQDTLSVQNCTHVNTQGSLYKFRYGYVVDKVIFNHNNFIDCSGFIFMNNGDQSNMSVTNNIFINCQLQGYCNALQTADEGEVDLDSLPMGLINLRVDSTFLANGARFYADRNLAYWDSSLADIISTLNTNHVNGSTDWVSQMILMNTRTAALFDDDVQYPHLVNGTWFNKLPAFKKTDILFTARLALVKAYSIAAVDINYKSPLTSWRQASNPEDHNFVHADWPSPIDRSYTDIDLLTAGLGGFPLGDLGWFPSQYAAWKAQEERELSQLDHVLITGDPTAVNKTDQLPGKFHLAQNYPNPFNPSTVISYQLPVISRVSLKVYDILGREIAQLVDEVKQPGRYSVRFDGATLSSGVYFYSLRAGAFHQVGKMVLTK